MKFERTKGLWGGRPRDWMDKNLQICPFCGHAPPLWELGVETHVTSMGRFHFRCPSCHGTLSVAMTLIMPKYGLMDYMASAGQSKDVLVESEGTVESHLVVGMEYSLSTLRSVARPPIIKQAIKPKPVFACPACNGDVSEDALECPHCHAEFEEVK